MKRRILLILLAVAASLCLALGLFACSDSNGSSSGTDSESTGSTEDTDGSGSDSGSEHIHFLRHVSAKEATCLEDGNIEYWYCTDCGKYFADSDAFQEVSETSVFTQAGHSPAEAVIENKIDATCTDNGSYDEVIYCLVCEEEISRTTVDIVATGHSYLDEWIINDEYHWRECEICQDIDYAVHDFEGRTCSVCNLSVDYTPNLSYSISDDGKYYIVTGIGSASETEIVIPSEHNGLPVAVIDSCAFSGCDSLISVTISDSITSIGENVFLDCMSFANIYVNEDNLYFCDINGVLFSKDATELIVYPEGKTDTSYSIPDSVTSIKADAFYKCSSLKSIIIGESVTAIGDYAFYDCSSLVSITIPDRVTSIGAYAFSGCASLESIIVGICVASIGDYAFYNCAALTEIYYNATACEDLTSNNGIFGNAGQDREGITVYIGENVKNIPNYLFNPQNASSHSPKIISIVFDDDSICTSIGSYSFAFLTSIECITIPDCVVYVGEYAFNGCVAEINWGDNPSIKEISSYAFAGYGGETLTIPESVTVIGNYAFYNCSLLAVITIPEGITTIGDYAFYGCSSITSIVVPDSVNTIGSAAFGGCSALQSITLPFVGGSANTSVASSSTLFGYIFGTSSYTGSASTQQRYSGSSYKTYYIPTTLKNVTITGGYVLYGAFYNCSNIMSITIGGVTSIGDRAFYNCTLLYSIIMPGDIISIGNYAFYNCVLLENLTIGSGVASIGEYAFSGCTALSELYYNATECADLNSSSCIFYNAGQSSDGITVTIGANVKIIPAYLFSSSSSTNTPYVVSVVFENDSQCTEIGSYAFYNCVSLTSVTIGNGVTSIGEWAFYNCTSLTAINYNATACNDLSSDNRIFYNAGQEGDGIIVTIGANVEKIPAYLFYPYSRNSSYAPKIVNVIFEDNSKCTSIGNYAFAYLTAFTCLTIPDSVTSIGNYAFYNCTSLTEIYYNATACEDLSSSNYVFYKAGQNSDGITVTIGANVTKIPAHLFYPYSSSSYSPNIVSVVFEEDSVCTSIGSSAFRYCTSLESVYITDLTAWLNISFSNYSDNPLYYAGSLYLDGELVTELVIPDSVTTINSYAFYGCSGFTNIVVPDSVTAIGSAAFGGCSSLESITLPFVGGSVESSVASSSTLFGYIFGTTSYTGGTSTTQYYTSSSSEIYYIPSSLTSVTITSGEILYGAFYNCSNLKIIAIGSYVTFIGEKAFSGCSALQSITLPFIGGSVESSVASSSTLFGYIFGTTSYTGGISTTQYYTSSSSETYYIPSSLTSVTITGGNILWGAFYNCTSLISITIFGSVNSIGRYAFQNCTAEIIWGDNLSITEIGTYAFAYYAGTSITIPDSVISIGSYAFYYCTSLASITIPDSVISIGSYAFYYCTSLASITIPDSVISIGSYAFYYCTSLASITIPDSVTYIGSYAFYYCTSLASITIPDSVTYIGSYAFYYCTSLASITIPASVTYIGSYAFYYCTSLTEIYYNATACADLSRSNYVFAYAGQNGNGIMVTIGANVTKVPAYLFYVYSGSSYTPHIVSVVFEKESVCTSIGDYAFYYSTSLTSITIPDSVTSIGNYAFYNCSLLESITLGNSVTSIGSYAFYGCSSLTGVHITDITAWLNISFSGYYANPLYYADSLYLNGELVTELVIPDEIITINSYAFQNCRSLTSVTIPDSVTSIGSYAFQNCRSLTSVTIPDSVTTIGMWAFSNCTSLNIVYYCGTADEWSSISISSDNTYLTDATIYYYSESEPAMNEDGTAYDGNFWYYNEDGEIVVWEYTSADENTDGE